MSDLTPFQFENSAIRVLRLNNEPWFVAKDVMVALEYSETSTNNIADRTAHVPEEWKGRYPIVTLGGTQELWCLSEPGLYFFVNRSDKPKALPFQKWVASEILPAIRKTGSYALPGRDSQALDALVLGREALALARLFGFTDNMALLSASTYARHFTGINVLECMGQTHLLADPRGMTYTPTELGKLMDPPLSAMKFNRRLEANGLVTKELDHWMPTSAALGLYEWLDTGKRHSDGTPVKQLKWFKSVLERS